MAKVIASRYRLDTGMIVDHFECSPQSAEANRGAGFGMWIGAHVPPDTHYIDVAAAPLKVAPRPALALPDPVQAPGWTWDLATLPGGTAVRVENPEGDAWDLDTSSGPVTIGEAGVYGVHVTPPAPFLSAAFDIEVRA